MLSEFRVLSSTGTEQTEGYSDLVLLSLASLGNFGSVLKCNEKC